MAGSFKAKAMRDFQAGDVAVYDCNHRVADTVFVDLLCADDVVCVIGRDCKRGESVDIFIDGVQNIRLVDSP